MPALTLDDAREALQRHFGHAAFRQGQEAIIASVLEGRDTVAIMPTGGGKSLCYQLPAMLFEGVTLVVSPLIALMKDQVDALVGRGLPATFLNSSLEPQEFEARMQGLKEGRYRLIYVAPERFRQRAFLEALQGIRIACLAIDEAHCVSQWGHDFRPDYMRLGEVRSRLGNPPVLAATATATVEVRQDLVRQLGMKAPAVFVFGFDRPNLRLVVRPASGEQGKLAKALEIVEKVPGPAIVYAATRKNAETIASHLQAAGHACALYHAGLGEDERAAAQDAWQGGRTRIIAATNAFGMGVDKQDVRLVIHYDLPGTLEAYYQEAGRAGRDGRGSYCVLLYSPADRYLQQFFIEGTSPGVTTLAGVYRVLCAQQADRLVMTHEAIARELPGKVHPMAIGTCLDLLERHGVIARAPRGMHQAYVKHALALMPLDSRAKTQRAVYRALKETLGSELDRGAMLDVASFALALEERRDTVLAALHALDERGLIRFTPPQRGRALEILRRVPRFEDLGLDVSFLEGKHARELQKLERMIGFATLTGCRRAYLLEHFGERSAPRCKACDRCLEPIVPLPVPQGEELTETLRAWRSEVARTEGLPAYCIVHDRVLERLAADPPGTAEALATFPGLGPDKARRFGPELMALFADRERLVSSGVAI